MKTVKWSETKRRANVARRAAGLPVPTAAERAAAVDRLRGEIHAWRLAELRRSLSLTQRDVAEEMGTSEPRVSQVEHAEVDRATVATVRAYVEALGGRLRLVADFGDDLIQIA
ncbi:MAG: XRE family transcriptional regulator [Haloechinothrix sp.]